MKIIMILACCLLSCLLGVLSIFMLAGCEGSANEDVSGAESYFDKHPYSSAPRPEPEALTLDVQPGVYVVSYINQEVLFTVSGGEGAYHWYLSMPANGEISSHGANQAVYIVRQVQENTITVQDDAGHYAVVYIQTASSTVPPTITPPSYALEGGQLQASFTVSGGRAPYTWISGNVKLGTVSYSAGTSHMCAYTAVAGVYGQNVITAVDAEGRIASATITQTQ